MSIPKSIAWRTMSCLVTLHIPVADSHVVNEVIPLGRALNLSWYKPNISRVQNRLRFHCLGNVMLLRLLIPGFSLVLWSLGASPCNAVSKQTDCSRLHGEFHLTAKKETKCYSLFLYPF